MNVHEMLGMCMALIHGTISGIWDWAAGNTISSSHIYNIWWNSATLLLFVSCQHYDADDFSDEPVIESSLYSFNVRSLNQVVQSAGRKHRVVISGTRWYAQLREQWPEKGRWAPVQYGTFIFTLIVLQILVCELARWKFVEDGVLHIVAMCCICDIHTFLRRIVRFIGSYKCKVRVVQFWNAIRVIRAVCVS